MIRRTREGNVEATFHLSHEVVKALKLRAVEDEKKLSKVAEGGRRQYLGLKETRRVCNYNLGVLIAISARTSNQKSDKVAISSTRRVMRRISYTYTTYPIYISRSHNNY